MRPGISSDHGPAPHLSAPLAHLIGFCGANLVVGTIVIWGLHEAGQSHAPAVPAFVVVSLVCLGAVLMLIGGRSLAQRPIWQPISGNTAATRRS